MKKVFWDNPYQNKLTTRVASVTGNRILFEETIAFSFSGGQENDKAYINGCEITHSEKVGTLRGPAGILVKRYQILASR